MTVQGRRRNLQRAAGFVADKIGRSPRLKARRVSPEHSPSSEHTNPAPMTDDNAEPSNVHSSSEDSTRLDPSSESSDFEDLDGFVDSGQTEEQAMAVVTSHDDPVEGFDRLSVQTPVEYHTPMPSPVTDRRSDMDVDNEHVQVEVRSPESNGDVTNKDAPSQPTIRQNAPDHKVVVALPTPSKGIVDDAFSAERKLLYVAGRMLAPDRPHTSVVSIERSFPREDTYELKRLRKLSAFKGTSRIKNLALCDPGTLMLVDGQYLKHSQKDKDNMFFLTGIAKFTSLLDDATNSRQIGFLPFASTWYRALAVLGAIFDMRTLHFASFYNCITMSTKTRNAGSSVGSQPEGLESLEEAKARPANVTDSWSLTVDSHVPIFDGRYRLNLNDLRESPEYHRELEPGSAVAAIFTVNAYRPYKSQVGKYHVDRSDLIISLNIRALVLVKDAHPGFTHIQRINAREMALGVEFPQVKVPASSLEPASSSPMDISEEDDPLAGVGSTTQGDTSALF